MNALSRLDRRVGAALRDATRAVPGGPASARLAAGAMSPAFRLVVACMIVRPATRRAGLEALAGGAGASIAARMLRDRLGRPRPGGRAEGGFPSRHAAASVAIARIASAEHEPADIVAGALLGVATTAALERMGGEGIGWPG